MDIRASWERARLLANQRRWDLAERELLQLLVAAPEFGPAHTLLGIVLGAQGRLDEGLASAQRGVGLAPDDPFAHRMLAALELDRGQPDAAAAAAQRAIELEPRDAAAHALLAHVRLRQRRWPEALAAADAALAVDPEDVDAANLRSAALVQLGRRAEALDTTAAALARDPDNPETHQARGFALLHQGDARAALHHFQEALRRDPELDGARQGLVEALKARNPIYRLLLSWMLWLGRFSRGRQRQILVAAWAIAFFGRRMLAAAGFDAPAQVIGFGWLGVVLFTACTVPIFNLLLLLHPVGRHALERRARLDALWLGAALLLLAGAFGLDLADRWAFANPLLWFCLFFLMPVAGLGLFGANWARRVLAALCIGLLLWVGYAAWSLEDFVAGHRVDDGLAGTLHARLAAADMEIARGWLTQFSTAMLAAALSSWFVLLAPKGSRRRR